MFALFPATNRKIHGKKRTFLASSTVYRIQATHVFNSFSSLIDRFVFANANGQKSGANFRFLQLFVDIEQLYRSKFHIV